MSIHTGSWMNSILGWLAGSGVPPVSGGRAGCPLSIPESSVPEDFLEQIRGLRRGILADLALFLAQFEKEPIEGLGYNVVGDVEVLILGEGKLFVLRNQGVVLLRDAVLGHRLFHHRSEGHGELWRGLVLEVVGGGGVAAGKNSAGVVEGHSNES